MFFGHDNGKKANVNISNVLAQRCVAALFPSTGKIISMPLNRTPTPRLRLRLVLVEYSLSVFAYRHCLNYNSELQYTRRFCSTRLSRLASRARLRALPGHAAALGPLRHSENLLLHAYSNLQ